METRTVLSASSTSAMMGHVPRPGDHPATDRSQVVEGDERVAEQAHLAPLGALDPHENQPGPRFAILEVMPATMTLGKAVFSVASWTTKAGRRRTSVASVVGTPA